MILYLVIMKRFILFILFFFIFSFPVFSCDILPPPALKERELPLLKGRWKRYGLNQGLLGENCLSLLSTKIGIEPVIFVGHRGAGLSYRYLNVTCKKNAKFLPVLLNQKKSVSIFGMVSDGEDLYCASNLGVIKVSLDEKPKFNSLLLQGTPCRGIAISKGGIFVGTSHGVFQVKGSGNIQISEKRDLTALDVLSLAPSSSGLLVGSRTGLYISNRGNTYHSYFGQPRFNEISRIHQDNYGGIVFNCLQGTILSWETGTIVLQEKFPELKNWCCSVYTQTGIEKIGNRLKKAGVDIFSLIRTMRREAQDNMDRVARELEEYYQQKAKEFEEKVKSGQYDEHMMRDTLVAQMVLGYQKYIDEYNRIEEEYWKFLQGLVKEILWMGTDRDGLFGLLGTHLLHFTKQNSILADDKINDITSSGPNTYWFASASGLYRYLVAPMFKQKPVFFSSKPSRELEIGDEYLLIGGMQDGLETYSRELEKIVAPRKFGLTDLSGVRVTAMTSSAMEGIFLGTAGDGILNIPPGVQGFLQRNDGLVSSKITAIHGMGEKKVLAAVSGAKDPLFFGIHFYQRPKWVLMDEKEFLNTLFRLLDAGDIDKIKDMLNISEDFADEEELKTKAGLKRIVREKLQKNKASLNAVITAIHNVEGSVILGSQKGDIHLLDNELRSTKTNVINAGIGQINAITHLKSGKVLFAGNNGLVEHAFYSFQKVQLPGIFTSLKITDVKLDPGNQRGYWISGSQNDFYGAIGYFDGKEWFTKVFQFGVNRMALDDSYIYGSTASGTFKLIYNPG
ncbi:hypothetical protein ACFL35_12570 [Candidatus Riflebacteria bacterium]